MEYTGVDNLEVMLTAKNYNSHIVEKISTHLKSGDRTLDLGAGLGIYAQALRAKSHIVRCLEIDPHLINSLKNSGFDVIESFQEIGVSSVDFIYSVNVLEHIEDEFMVLKKCYERLSTGGRLYLYVPAFQHLYTAMDKKVGHHRRYTRQGLQKLVKEAGFHVEFCEYTDSLGYFATLAYKAFGSRRGDIDTRTIGFYDRYLFPISQKLDRISGTVFGKNVHLLAAKP